MSTPLFRKMLGGAIVASIALGALPTFAATAFTDVSAQTKYRSAIESLAADGVVQGYASGKFEPLSGINRAEFLKIVLEAKGGSSLNADDCFPDVKKTDWFSKYVCSAQAAEIIAGYPDGTFKPERAINFVEASKIVALAYDQQVQGGGEWYEPYVRAIESSKAIPPSVAALDANLNRGEMAEIMWRLEEGKTDQPTKGYLNVKYPDVAVNFASDDVQTAKSCVDLRAFAEEASQTQNMMYYRGNALMEDRATTAAPAMDGAKNETQQSGGASEADHSETNVQVQGVDEGDVVKTDGTNLYMIRGQTVRLIKASPATDMKEVAVIKGDDAFTPQDLYVDGDMLTVVGQQWIQQNYPYPMPLMEKRMIAPDMYPYWSTTKTVVRLYDISNAAAPDMVREVSFEGSSVATRRIEDKLYLVLQQPMRFGGPIRIMEDELLPTFSDTATGQKDAPVTRCGNVSILPHVPYPEYLTVAVMPIDEDAKVQTEVILGNAQNVFMSLDNLYVATTEWNYVWDAVNPQSNEKTNVFRFDVTDNGVAFGEKGSVPGHILNQFSMDEHESHFRIATTQVDDWATGKTSNGLYVLDRAMKQVGSIEDIAPGETIYSTRFLGDRTYMVTFRKIDPLFVIDTSNPRAPKILGKLKIPGYSDYLHPYDETHLIGFGKDAVESKTGDFAWYQGMKVAMFDVSDVENPKEMHTLMIGDRGTESPLLHNHKALLFEKDRDLLAFPITLAEIPASQKVGNDGSAYGTPVFQGAYVYDISLKDGFVKRGQMTHYDADTFTKAGDYWYGGDKDIQRIVRVGSSLYSLSNGGVQAHDEKTVKMQGEVEFKD